MISRVPYELRARRAAKPPQVAYKFFSSEFERSIRDHGRVALGTKEAFRVDDGVGDGMNDPEELCWIFEADRDHEFPKGHPISNHLANLDGLHPDREVAIHLPKGTRIRFGTMSFIFCATGFLDRLICKRMWQRFGYDRYYKIHNIAAFADAIISADKDLFHAHVEWMQYDNRSILSNDPNILLQPFRKNRRFQWQSEIRIFFGQRQNRTPRLVDAPGILPFITFFDNPEAPQDSR